MNVGVEDIVVAGVIVCASVAGIITHVLLLIALKVSVSKLCGLFNRTYKNFSEILWNK